MKKEIKLVAIVLVALIVFLSGFGLGATKGININLSGDINVNDSGSSSEDVAATTTVTTTAAAETTTAAASTDDTAETTTAAAAADDTADTTAAASTSALPTGVDEIAAKYNEVVNAAKTAQNVTIYRYEAISLNLTDCSISFATSTVNSILQQFVTPTERTTPITDGFTDGGTGENTATNYIYPMDRDAEVQGSYLTSATAVENADGGYTLTLNFAAETSDFDGTTTTDPTGHNSAMDPLNLGTLDISPATIDSASMSYPGATVVATVNADGLLVKQEITLPMSGGGSGSVIGFSVSLEIDGSMDAYIDLTY
ncbi:MAG: hypothetical protein R3Y27_06655 [Clostridia bacterium]